MAPDELAVLTIFWTVIGFLLLLVANGIARIARWRDEREERRKVARWFADADARARAIEPDSCGTDAA